VWRKKRKSRHEGTDYQQIDQLRVRVQPHILIIILTHAYQVMHRKHPSRTKPTPLQSPGGDLLAHETTEFLKGTTKEELLLASSDLEDCEEVWIGELSDYMLETQKRQNQVTDWFEASIVVSRSW